MKTYIFCYSSKGCILAQSVSKLFNDSECVTTVKLANTYGFVGEESVCRKAGEVFHKAKAMIFIGACGIAVRAIAPFLKNKAVDPPVIVIDDCGLNVISLLSGHIGGANDLAIYIANTINAHPVISTATDVNNRFSVDSWAVKNDLVIGSMKTAKDISAEILERNIAIKTDICIKGNLPQGLEYGDKGKYGIFVSNKTDNPFSNTLHIIPRNLHVGIGCKKHTPFNKVEELFLSVFKQNNLNIKSVSSFSSIDIKSDEAAILKLGEKYRIPIYFYSAEELSMLDGEFTKSEFVKSITGVDNVCERASYRSSDAGENIIRKTSHDGVTIAVCESKTEVQF